MVITYDPNNMAWFWKRFSKEHGSFVGVWYEVYIDFEDDVYDPAIPLAQNIENAYNYLKEHRNDYD